MTAPGNSIVLILLLAAFLACTGYAGGRLHQWYRMGQDRDEAYRDGYDTATRSVFSMAARIISPRRTDRSAIRASAAVVIPASAVVETATSPLPGMPVPARPAVAARPHPSSGDFLVDALSDGSWPAAESSGGSPLASESAPPGAPAPHPETLPDDPARPLAFRSAHPRQDALPVPPFTSPTGADGVMGSADVFMTGASAGSDDASARQATADESHTRSTALSVADGGRRASETMAGGRDVPDASADGGRDVFGADTGDGRDVSGAESGGGRHMVPDELVQAATYRLPPDRVARAKVRGAFTPSELANDPTCWLPPPPHPGPTQ
jgi:hypothetical protein